MTHEPHDSDDRGVQEELDRVTQEIKQQNEERAKAVLYIIVFLGYGIWYTFQVGAAILLVHDTWNDILVDIMNAPFKKLDWTHAGFIGLLLIIGYWTLQSRYKRRK